MIIATFRYGASLLFFNAAQSVQAMLGDAEGLGTQVL